MVLPQDPSTEQRHSHCHRPSCQFPGERPHLTGYGAHDAAVVKRPCRVSRPGCLPGICRAYIWPPWPAHEHEEYSGSWRASTVCTVHARYAYRSARCTARLRTRTSTIIATGWQPTVNASLPQSVEHYVNFLSSNISSSLRAPASSPRLFALGVTEAGTEPSGSTCWLQKHRRASLAEPGLKMGLRFLRIS